MRDGRRRGRLEHFDLGEFFRNGGEQIHEGVADARREDLCIRLERTSTLGARQDPVPLRF